MTPAAHLALLEQFLRETLDLFHSRQAHSWSVAAYDANNGYQQVLGRQEVHLRWLSDAIADLGGKGVEAPHQAGVPVRSGEDARAIIERDARTQQAFIDAWSPRIPDLTNARHRKMLALILGEMREHLRVLQQAGESRSDLLGRHADGKILRGSVLAVRPQN